MGQHAAFDGLKQFWKIPVAIIEAAFGGADADNRFIKRGARVTHGFCKGAAQITRKIRVAVICQALIEAPVAVMGPISHLRLPAPSGGGHIWAPDSR